jgi:hypothetical protein
MREASPTSALLTALRFTAMLPTAILCTVLVWVAAASQCLDIRENVSSRCMTDGDQTGALHSEVALLHAEATVFPAGWLCVWAVSGGGVIHDQSGWLTTTAAVVATLAALVLLQRRARIIRSNTALVVLTTIMALGWVVMILTGLFY